MRIGNWIILEKISASKEIIMLKNQVLELAKELSETRKLVRKCIKVTPIGVEH